jgi:hypothetical protein
MFLLAQTTPTAVPAEYGWHFILVASLVLSATVNVLSVVNFARSRKETQKREVSFAQEFVSKELCAQSHSQLAVRLTRSEAELLEARHELKADCAALDQLIRAEVGQLHQRINDVLAAVAELRGRLDPPRF